MNPAMVTLKGPENLLDFNPSRLMERKVSCRFLNTARRQILTRSCLLMSERSRVMACSSVTYEYMEFYETWPKLREKYGKIKYNET